MYGTCLFCSNALGRNEALEHFPVGRRLAYDEAKGRLWVICRRCERWNLTPLETRWEAIEEAERAFRVTRLRIATDNIGLARLDEGLELVRVGRPPRLELAGWRYGDQFGRRRRKYVALGVLGVSAATLSGFGWTLGLGASLLGSGAMMTYNLLVALRRWKDNKVPTVLLTDDKGNILPLAKGDTGSAMLVTVPRSGEWYLTVRHRMPVPADTARGFVVRRLRMEPAHERAILTGLAAHRALATLVPYANPAGGTARTIRDAVGVIESSSNVDQLVYNAAGFTKNPAGFPAEFNALTQLPAPVRLALEMVLHEEDERRAMEGQLAALEQRWREAEEIANIADSLLIPAGTEARFEALRQKE